MPRVELRLFGVPTVVVDGDAAALSGTAAALVGFVAVNARRTGSVARNDVAFGLWPDRSEAQARRALNDASYRLRVGSTSAIVTSDATALALKPDVSVDLYRFDDGVTSSDPSRWTEALDHYRGPLLHDVDAPWADAERRRTERLYVETVTRAWQYATERGDHDGALALAHRWVAADTYSEPAHRALMRSWEGVGDLRAALEQFDALRRVLDDELGVEPDAESRALADHLRAEHSARRAGSTRAQPLVGRVAERRRLVEALDAAVGGRGGVIVLLGDPGIGKTRLLEELEGAARWRSATVSRVDGDDRDRMSPFGAVLRLLRVATPPLRRAQLRELIDPAWVDQLDAMVPGGPPGDSAAASADDATVATWAGVERELAPVARRVLGGLQQLAPQLLIVDDLHWSDGDTWRLISDLRPMLQSSRVCLAIAARRDELMDHPDAWPIVCQWDADGGDVVPVGPLAGSEVEALTVAAGADRSRVASIVEASGGNPLVALALADADVSAATAGGEGTGPADTVDGLVRRRLDALGDVECHAVTAAAVLGRSFDYVTWRDVAALDGINGLASIAAALEAVGLISAEASSYRFAHDTVRSAVLGMTTPERRRRIHGLALKVLDSDRSDLGRLLVHAEGAGDRLAIERLGLEAGVAALDVSAYRAARDHFGRVLAATTDVTTRRVSLVGLVRALHVLGEREPEASAITDLESLAADGGDVLDIAEARRLRADWLVATGALTEAQTVAESVGQALAPAEHPPSEHALRTLAACDSVLAFVHRSLGQMDQSREAAERGRHRYEVLGDVAGQASVLDQLGGLAWAAGSYGEAAALHERAADLFASIGGAAGRAQALNNLGSAQWGLGDHLGARRTHLQAIDLAQALGHRSSEGDNIDNLGGVEWALGNYPGAIEHYERALAIRRASDDPWGVSISLSNLGDTYRLLGDPQRAIEFYKESIEANQRAGVVRNETTTRQSLAMALADCGELERARELLTEALATQLELSDHRNVQEARVGLATVELALGDLGAASALIEAAVAEQRADDQPDLRVQVHLAAWKLAVAQADGAAATDALVAARQAQRQQVERLDQASAERLMTAVPWHRELREAIADAADTVTVRLAPLDAPPGRVVADHELITVTWTLREPGDADTGSADVRRTVLMRLLDQAAAAGGAPTDDDLANSLGVSRRTVLRDLDALRSNGVATPTRGRPANR